MTTNINELKRLLAEATPGPWLHETMAKCVSGGTPLRAICRWSADRNDADLIVAAVNALPTLLTDLDEVIRDRNEWADSTRGANKRMREAEERVTLLRCDLEAAQKREQVLRDELTRLRDVVSAVEYDAIDAALADAEVKP